VAVQAAVDGENLGTIGLRMRGGSGSFQRWGRKPKLKLDFNRFNPDGRLADRKALLLNNWGSDCTAKQEVLASEVYAHAGVAVSQAGYAELFVNGESWGLYVTVEDPNDDWLERVYGHDEGELFDGSYVWARWLPRFLDFGTGRDDTFDHEEGDGSRTRLTRVSEGVKASIDAGALTPELRDEVDWDAVHRLFAVEQWVGNEDAYVLNRNNYKVWFPNDGGMSLAAWDLDHTFRVPTNDLWSSVATWRDDPRGRLAIACYLDEDCEARQREVAREVADRMDEQDWEARLAELSSLVDGAVDVDTRTKCETEQTSTARADLEDWLPGASAALRDAWN
jgi:spore coat protein CotH